MQESETSAYNEPSSLSSAPDESLSGASKPEKNKQEEPDIEVPQIDIPDGWELARFELSIPDIDDNYTENPENVRVYAAIPDLWEIKDPFPDIPFTRSVELRYKTGERQRGNIHCRQIADESDPLANLGMPYEDEKSSIVQIGDKNVKVLQHNVPDKGGPLHYQCNYIFAAEGVLIHLSLFFHEPEKPEIPEIYEQIVSSMVVTRF